MSGESGEEGKEKSRKEERVGDEEMGGEWRGREGEIREGMREERQYNILGGQVSFQLVNKCYLLFVACGLASTELFFFFFFAHFPLFWINATYSILSRYCFC